MSLPGVGTPSVSVIKGMEKKGSTSASSNSATDAETVSSGCDAIRRCDVAQRDTAGASLVAGKLKRVT